MRARSRSNFSLFACAALLTAGLVTGAAVARTPNGVSFPPSKTVDGATLALNGTGTRTVSYFLDAYASALYLRMPAHTVQAVLAEPGPKMLITKYLHDATVAQTDTEYKAIYNKFCSSNPCSHQSYASFQRVLDAVTPIHVGDSSSYVIDNGTLTISRNDRTVLTLRDPEYARGFLAAITGPSAPTAEYADGLLGKD